MLHGFEGFVAETYEKKATVRAYIKDAELFADYIRENQLVWEEVRERHIKQFNRRLKEEGYTDHSVARKNSSLRLLMKYLRKKAVMTHNPMEDIKQPTLQKRDVLLSEQEKNSLRENMKEDARDYLLYALLVDEKIKVADIIAIQRKDVDAQNRILYLPKKALTVREETMKLLCGEENKEAQDYVCANRHGQPLSVNGVHFILKKHLQKIGREDIRPNDLRR